MSISSMFKRYYAPEAQDQGTWTGSICEEKDFIRVLARERARAERSAQRFALVIFESGSGEQNRIAETSLLNELTIRLRTTDEAGWLRQNRIGAILHNATAHNGWCFANNIQASLLASGIKIICQVYSYPSQQQKNGTDDGDQVPGKKTEGAASNGQQYNFDYPQEELHPYYTRKITRMKRCIDLLGALIGLTILSPVFIIIWCMIKYVSPGPAIYRQTRIGLGGRPFTFLKFRTMETDADTIAHRNYLSSLINGDKTQQNRPQAMLKLDDCNDSIICFGKLLRKTYLDELPQLFNVLLGDMSLIGPRPPIPYEVEEYQLWHTSRFDTTPGMTGLWQVSGKNRLTFDQMVRLDIRYVRKQSFWLDLKILLMTPVAIASEFKVGLNRIGQIRVGTEEVKF